MKPVFTSLTATLRIASLLCLLLCTTLLQADDTDIYKHAAECSVPSNEKFRFIFIVDNSGSMSSWEFEQSRATINGAIDTILDSGLRDVKVAVVQYGTNHDSLTHKYNVTVPFTSNRSRAFNWNRHYGSGTANPRDFQDHLPASLSRMRREGVYNAGRALDVTQATNVQFVLFTDARRNVQSGCCSSLYSEDSRRVHGNLSNVLPRFGEYDVLKNGSALPKGLKAQFTVLHVASQSSDQAAAAAIASKGGEYTGFVEYNSSDPDGPATRPRRYVEGNFTVTDTTRIVGLLEQVVSEIREATYTTVAPAVSVNAFNELQHRDELYFSIFQPSSSARWSGNVKKYTISANGVILDAKGQPAIDPDTDTLAETARSYWSSTNDGADVEAGGYRSKLTNNQTIYTDPTALESLPDDSSKLITIEANSSIKLDLMGLTKDSGSSQCVVNGEKSNGTVTLSDKPVEVESGLALDRGKVQLRFAVSAPVSARATVKGTGRDSSTRHYCEDEYDNTSTIHECSFSVEQDNRTLDLEFTALDDEATIEYQLEYNIPDSESSSSCNNAREERIELLSWISGVDVYNDDGDSSHTDAHHYAADPLHSQPFVVTYSGSSKANSREVMFVTDNLGMVHAIDPADSKGTKIWSYMPEEHLDNIKKAARNKAGQDKTYGLDGPMSFVQREARDSSPSNFKLREATLYVGERRGGRNYYALDVTKAPVRNARPELKWKIHGGQSDRFSDLGQTWSPMLPKRLAYNCTALGKDCQYIEVLIFGGGYDTAYDDPAASVTNALGNAIYIVDLETGGQKFFWSAGRNDDDRRAHKHNLAINIRDSVVGAPTTIDTNGDGAVDILYAIDLGGHIIRIDFDSLLSKGSGSANSLDSLSANGAVIARLSKNSLKRRFYNALDVSRTDPRSGRDSFAIAVGSGYRAHPNDMNEAVNQLYVIFDPNTTPFGAKHSHDKAIKRAHYRYVNGTKIITPAQLTKASLANESNSQYGIYLDATHAGEKFLQPSLTANGTLIISSFVPDTNNKNDCGIGTGKAYFLDLNTLKSRFSESSVALKTEGIPPPTSILRLPKVAICIGVDCSVVAPSPTNSEGEVDCDPSAFNQSVYGSDFAAAASSAMCGLENGRAYRASWLER